QTGRVISNVGHTVAEVSPITPNPDAVARQEASGGWIQIPRPKIVIARFGIVPLSGEQERTGRGPRDGRHPIIGIIAPPEDGSVSITGRQDAVQIVRMVIGI